MGNDFILFIFDKPRSIAKEATQRRSANELIETTNVYIRNEFIDWNRPFSQRYLFKGFKEKNDAKQNAALIYIKKGLELKNLKQIAESIQSYDKAIAIDPNCATAYNNKGNSLSLLNKFQEAIVNYDRAIQIEPMYALAFVNKGLACYSLKKYQEAIDIFDRSIQLDPELASAYNSKGEIEILIA